jgi:hypothetical protein
MYSLLIHILTITEVVEKLSNDFFIQKSIFQHIY